MVFTDFSTSDTSAVLSSVSTAVARTGTGVVLRVREPAEEVAGLHEEDLRAEKDGRESAEELESESRSDDDELKTARARRAWDRCRVEEEAIMME